VCRRWLKSQIKTTDALQREKELDDTSLSSSEEDEDKEEHNPSATSLGHQDINTSDRPIVTAESGHSSSIS